MSSFRGEVNKAKQRELLPNAFPCPRGTEPENWSHDYRQGPPAASYDGTTRTLASEFHATCTRCGDMIGAYRS